MMQYSTPFLFLLDGRRLQVDGPGAGGVEPDVGRLVVDDVPAGHAGADAAGDDERVHPVLHPRRGELRVRADLRLAGRHRGDHDGDLPPDSSRQHARLPAGHRAGPRHHGADVRAGRLAVAAARRPQLLHRDRQGLHAAGGPARPLALGDVRLLHPLLRDHGGAAGEPARRRLLLQVLRLLPDEHADDRSLRRGLAEPAGVARARQHAAAGAAGRHRHHAPRRGRRLRPRAHARAACGR